MTNHFYDMKTGGIRVLEAGVVRAATDFSSICTVTSIARYVRWRRPLVRTVVLLERGGLL